LATPKIIMYATGWCPYCARAREILASKNAVVEEIDVDARAGARAEMVARSGRRTVPQIFIGETYVGGCEDLEELDGSGGLDPLLTQGTRDDNE
jgi:glutaredoxin 3